MEPKNQKAMIETVDMERILSRDIGRVSPLQIRTVLLCALTSMLSSLVSNEYVFTAGRIKSRCLIPECEGPNPVEFEPSWLANAVPYTDDNFESCLRFANTSTKITSVDDDFCPATQFDRQTIISCEQQVYEHTNTAVYDLDLGCSEWLRSFLGSARTAGSLISLPLAGFISDRWGRRTAFAVITFNTAVIGLSRYFVKTYVWYIILVFAESSLGAGAKFASAYVYGVELVPTNHRLITGTFLFICNYCGPVILGLMAWKVQNWRYLTLIIYSLQLLSLAYFCLLTESVRWSVSKGRYEEAEIILTKIAKSCGKELTNETLLELRAGKREEKERHEDKTKEETWLFALVLQNKPILLRCLVAPIWWITLVFIYHGLTVNAVNIGGNQYFNFIVVMAAGIPGLLSAYALNIYIGRKTVLMVSFWVCCLCQVAYIFVPRDMYALSLTVYLIGKFSVAHVASTIYLYTSELFPTQYRSRLFGYCSSIGRIGSILSPLTPALAALVWDDLPYVLFGTMSFLSAFLLLLTPETRGSRLPDSMEEAANIGQNHNTA